MSLSFANVNGPVRYEKVVLHIRGVSHIIHFFSDDHVKTTACDEKENPIDLHTLVANTLTVHTLTDIVYEGQDRQKSLVGNYLREFRNAFPSQCWEKHTCDSFPDTIFHSVDIRGIINSDWVREINRIKHALETDDLQRNPGVQYYLRTAMKLGGSVPQKLLRAWMDSLLIVSGRLAVTYEELAEDWVRWIRKGRPMDTFVENELRDQSILPVSYDKYILTQVEVVDVMYQPYLDRWLEESYRSVMDHPYLNVHASLAFMVDLTTIRVLLSLRNPYAIVYMGHQHTFTVLNYLKQVAHDIDESYVTYTDSFHSSDTPKGNPIQCLRIPVRSHGVLPMDTDMYETLSRKIPAWKYYGRSLIRRRKVKQRKVSCKK